MRRQPASRLQRFREVLYVIVFEAETPLGQAFDIALLIFIAMSVILTMLETVHSYWVHHMLFFQSAEVIFACVFAAEYALRVLIARPGPLAYICSFFGVVDILSVLPTTVEYLSPVTIGTSSLRIVRVLRLLRVFRVLHFAGLNSEVDELRAAFWASRRKVLVFLLFIMTVVTVMGTVIYVLEDNRNSGFTSIPRSIYWAIVTVTTVGYGDIAPQTIAGQIVASLMMTLGYSILVVPTSITLADYALHGSGVHRRTRNPRELRTADQGNLLICPVCVEVDHDRDALFCKYCGAELSR